MKKVARRVKKAWRNRGVRNTVRGYFGPGKKTLSASKQGLLGKKSSGISKPGVAKGLSQEQRRKLLNANVRMSAKYSLDALRIRDPKLRSDIYKICQDYSIRLAQEFGRVLGADRILNTPESRDAGIVHMLRISRLEMIMERLLNKFQENVNEVFEDKKTASRFMTLYQKKGQKIGDFFGM